MAPGLSVIQHFIDLVAQVLLQQSVEILVRKRNVVAAVFGTHLESRPDLLRITHLDACGQQLLRSGFERRFERLLFRLRQQGLNWFFDESAPLQFLATVSSICFTNSGSSVAAFTAGAVLLAIIMELISA